MRRIYFCVPVAFWQQTHFNLLGQGQGATPASGPVTRWPDNRIGYSHEAAWRYDEFGNRIEQLSFEGLPDGQGDHQAQHLVYDGAHRLTRITQPGRSSSYRYDALGRRLSRHTQDAEGEGASQTYYGWDGDRLIHTEQIESQAPEQRRITHTVYEPDSFTPLVQLSTTQTASAAKPQMLGLMLQEAQEPEEAPMVQMLGALPKDMQQALEQSLRQAMEGGIPSAMRTLMGEDQSQNTLQRLTGLREQLEKQEQSQKTPITVRHYHCDHLGTPIALSDQEKNIVWAAKLDPWGNVEEEFNPHRIEQSIRLPGQHHDRDTGLYYNRHRYYDPTIGAYVNQDPIGYWGGMNLFGYVEGKPLAAIDPRGLQAYMCAAGLPAWCSNSPPPSSSLSSLFPNSRQGWADALAKQGKIFGQAGIVFSAVPVLAPTAPVYAGVGIVLDGVSKTLSPPSPFILATDAALDLAGAAAPGGPLKDIGFEALKEINSVLDSQVQKQRAVDAMLENYKKPPICKR